MNKERNMQVLASQLESVNVACHPWMAGPHPWITLPSMDGRNSHRTLHTSRRWSHPLIAACYPWTVMLSMDGVAIHR